MDIEDSVKSESLVNYRIRYENGEETIYIKTFIMRLS